MDHIKIARKANQCLNEVATAEAPFRQVDYFLWRLRADPAWTEEEIIEVQTHVIRELMRQRDENQRPG